MWPARTGSPRASDSLAQQASLPIRTFRKVDWMWRGWIRRDLACWAALLAWPAAANPIAPDRLGHASASAWRELPQYFKTTRPVTRHGSPRLSEMEMERLFPYSHRSRGSERAMKFTALPLLLFLAEITGLSHSFVQDVPSSVKIRANDTPPPPTAGNVESVLHAGALAWISSSQSSDDPSWSDKLAQTKNYKSDKVKRVLDSSTVQLEKTGNVSLQTVRGASSIENTGPRSLEPC